MGCAQETLEYILDYLHREFVNPNYLEEFVQANTNSKFKLAKKLDDSGCTPKCASHSTFGLQTTELTSCSKCKSVDEVNDVEAKFMEQYYVAQILEYCKSVKKEDQTLSKVLAGIIFEDGMTHIENREKKLCRICKIPLRVDTKWLLEVP